MTGAILAQNSGTGQAAPQAGSTDTIAEDALTVPSGKGGTVEACFLSAQEYEKMKADRSETDFDPSCLFFEGLPVPYDKESNTVYIPQSCETSAWEGMLRAAVSEQEICILNDEPDDKRKCIEEGRSLSLAVVTERKYMECSLVFTGLPAVCISNDEGEVRYGEDYSGPILVLDPYREEYQDCACSFHIRGATSLLFDKKSYRVELKNAEGENAKESFLGMRRDDDWILNSLCTDRSLAREKICYELWEKLNGMEEEPVPSSRIEYCELFLNNEYLGVFGLQYPVDKKLMKLVPGDLLYKVGTWYEESDYSGNLTDPENLTDFKAYADPRIPGSLPGLIQDQIRNRHNCRGSFADFIGFLLIHIYRHKALDALSADHCRHGKGDSVDIKGTVHEGCDGEDGFFIAHDCLADPACSHCYAEEGILFPVAEVSGVKAHTFHNLFQEGVGIRITAHLKEVIERNTGNTGAGPDRNLGAAMLTHDEGMDIAGIYIEFLPDQRFDTGCVSDRSDTHDPALRNLNVFQCSISQDIDRVRDDQEDGLCVSLSDLRDNRFKDIYVLTDEIHTCVAFDPGFSRGNHDNAGIGEIVIPASVDIHWFHK